MVKIAKYVGFWAGFCVYRRSYLVFNMVRRNSVLEKSLGTRDIDHSLECGSERNGDGCSRYYCWLPHAGTTQRDYYYYYYYYYCLCVLCTYICTAYMQRDKDTTTRIGPTPDKNGEIIDQSQEGVTAVFLFLPLPAPAVRSQIWVGRVPSTHHSNRTHYYSPSRT